MVSQRRLKLPGSLKLNSISELEADEDLLGVAGGVSGAGVGTGGGGGGMTNMGGTGDKVGFVSVVVTLSLSKIGRTLVTTLLDGMAPGIYLKEKVILLNNHKVTQMQGRIRIRLST